MKKVIPFKKDIPFDTTISEITSISLEHSLKLEKDDFIGGEFIVSGDYKILDTSVNQEGFVHHLPFSITLDERYSIDNARIDIDDFYYEIVNDNILRVNIDVLLDGLEVPPLSTASTISEAPEVTEVTNKEDDFIGVRGLDDNIDMDMDYEDDRRDVVDLFKEEKIPPIPVMSQISEDKIKSLFDNFDEKDETFTTYHVHIVRQEDTIDTIIAKYNTTKDELTFYNKIDEIKIGDKIIIPAHKNE